MNSGFFTQRQRYQVPHDRIGWRKVLIVHQAINRAFEIIRQEGFALSGTLENDVTIKLLSVLNNQVLNRGEVEGFDCTFFGKMRRVEVVNHDGTKKAKKPDVCFELRREHRVEWDQEQDALFAECKPVDNKHLLKNHYCAVRKDCSGIERFVIGDYAWAMEEALMIGYVRDGYTIPDDLGKALNNKTSRLHLGDPTSLVKAGAATDSGSSNLLYKTNHKRLFSWKDGTPATPIDLFHSWHNCE